MKHPRSCPIALVGLALLMGEVSVGQWYWQNPLPTGSALYAVSLIDASTATVVGGGGCILRTTDRGITWTIQRSGTTASLHGVSFTNANTGTAVGSAGTILRTTNGGTSWMPQSSGTAASLLGVVFTDAATGTVVGDAGTILRTTNGGMLWARQASGTDAPLRAVSFTDAVTGTTVGGYHEWSGTSAVGRITSTILHTTNGGATWQSQATGTEVPLYGVSFAEASTGIAVGFSYGWLWATEHIVRTTDGGATWLTAHRNTRGGSLLATTMSDTKNATVVGGDAILRTTDGGLSWRNQGAPHNGLFGVAFFDELLGMAVGYAGVILGTSDGGAVWASHSSGTRSNLTGVAFSDANTGTAVGSDGIIVRTTNGGATWTTQVDTSAYTFTGVAFTDANTGTAVGWSGTVLRTTNGGTTWRSQFPGGNYHVTCVSFADAATGIAFAHLPHTLTMLRTTDGGATWENRTMYWPVSNGISAVHMSDPLNATAVGDGEIRRTTDGGHTWASQSSGVTDPYVFLGGVYFSNPLTGTVVGSSMTDSGNVSIILHTTNGGASWIRQQCGIDIALNDVAFADASTGMVVGAGGTILHTTDGGVTWSLQASGTNNDLFSVSCPDVRTATAVGANGTILHTTTGGVTWIAAGVPFTSQVFSLGQNYPNPFNPRTTITFELPCPADVSLRVYDPLGREVSLLVDGKRDAGLHAVTLDGTGLASGVYFYRLRARAGENGRPTEFVLTKKLLLLH